MIADLIFFKEKSINNKLISKFNIINIQKLR